MEKNISINEYICDKLTLLKQENSIVYDKVYDVLSFIYHDIDKEYYSKLKDKYEMEDLVKKAGDRDYRDNRAYYLEREHDELFNTFINKEQGIIDLLFELALSKDKIFQDKFFESISLPINMYREGVVFNSTPASYIYNLYAMLYAYSSNKGNYQNYEAIVDDIKHNLITDGNYYGNKENYYADKKEMINKFLEIPNYYQNTSIRELFKKIMSRFKYRLEDEEKMKYKVMLNSFSKLYDGIKEAKKQGITLDEEIINEIEQDLTSLAKDLDKEVYLERVLLFNNRYQFIKERLPKLDETSNVRQTIIGKMGNLDNSFFEYLNSLNIYDGDSFNEIMKIVFDSDSFQGLFRRLDSVSQASYSYQKQDKETALRIVKELTSEKHDQHYDGVPIILPQNANNITKPDSIAERMILFFEMAFDIRIGSRCLIEYRNGTYSDYNEFVSNLESKVEEEISTRQQQSQTTSPTLEKEPKTKKGFFSRF